MKEEESTVSRVFARWEALPVLRLPNLTSSTLRVQGSRILLTSDRINAQRINAQRINLDQRATPEPA